MGGHRVPRGARLARDRRARRPVAPTRVGGAAMIDPLRRLATLVLCLCLLGGCGAAQQRAPAPSPTARSSAVAQAGAVAARGLALLEQGDHVRAEQYLMLALRAGYDEHALID